MPVDPQTFLRLSMLREFLAHSEKLKKNLLQELITRATDPVIRMRRFRMLRQLSHYESQIIKKIENLQTDDSYDFVFYRNSLRHETNQIVNKSA
jgi:hypothetical protein